MRCPGPVETPVGRNRLLAPLGSAGLPKPGSERRPAPSQALRPQRSAYRSLLSERGFSWGERFIQSPSLQSWLLFAATCKNMFLGPSSQRSDARSLLRELLGRKGAIPHSPVAQGVRAPGTAGTPVRTICRGGRSGGLCTCRGDAWELFVGARSPLLPPVLADVMRQSQRGAKERSGVGIQWIRSQECPCLEGEGEGAGQ